MIEKKEWWTILQNDNPILIGILLAVGIPVFLKLIATFLNSQIKMKTDSDHIASPSVILITLGILKGYLTHPLFFLFSVISSLPAFIRQYKKNYPSDFLRSAGLMTLMYKRLRAHIGDEKAFEIIRCIMISNGMAIQQANFRNAEEPRNFINLVKNQQRTHREGSTKLNKMEIQEQSDTLYRFKVTRCLFYEFFSQQDVPELTRLMCSIDNGIFNTYSPEKIIFHRGGIGKRIIDGHDFCQFILERRE